MKEHTRGAALLEPGSWLSWLLLLLILLFAVFPFYIMLKSSLEPAERILDSFHLFPDHWLYFDNYKAVLSQYPIGTWFYNSALIALAAVAGNLILDPLAAYALARLRFPGRSAVFLVVISALIVPLQVIVVPLYLLMAQLHWVNTYLAVIMPLMVSPFGIFLLRQAFLAVPRELDEAALIDGCSRFSLLFRVLLPNILPTLATTAVLKFMWSWGDFMWPSLVLDRDSLRTLPIGIALFQTSSGLIPWNLVITASIFAVVPIIVLFFFLQRYFIRGLTEGAVKG